MSTQGLVQTSRFFEIPPHVARYLGSAHLQASIPKQLYPGITLDASFREITLLDELHTLAEKFYACSTPFRACHTLHQVFKSVMHDLGKKIVAKMEEIGSAQRAVLISKCVSSGVYLNALKVYFYCKPSAMYNTSANDVFEENILHIALSCADNDRSLAFISFILRMNENHSLGLLEQKDQIYGNRPLDKLFRRSLTPPSFTYVLLKRLLADPTMKDSTTEKVNSLIKITDFVRDLIEVTPIFLLVRHPNPTQEMEESIMGNIRLLQLYGADIDKVNDKNNTALHLALAGQYPIVLLLKCGANPNKPNGEGKTPLEICCFKRSRINNNNDKLKEYYRKSFELLLEYRAEIPFSLAHYFKNESINVKL